MLRPGQIWQNIQFPHIRFRITREVKPSLDWLVQYVSVPENYEVLATRSQEWILNFNQQVN